MLSSLDSCVFPQDAPGHIQDEWLSLPWEQVLEACRRPGRQSSPRPSGGPGPGPSAGVWGTRCVGPGCLRGHH